MKLYCVVCHIHWVINQLGVYSTYEYIFTLNLIHSELLPKQKLALELIEWV